MIADDNGPVALAGIMETINQSMEKKYLCGNCYFPSVYSVITSKRILRSNLVCYERNWSNPYFTSNRKACYLLNKLQWGCSNYLTHDNYKVIDNYTVDEKYN